MKKRAAKIVSLACGAIFALMGASTALAQCPLCKVAAAASGDSAADTLNTAILVLLIPPVLIFCAIFFVAYRLRAGAQGEAASETPKEEWVGHAWLADPEASGQAKRRSGSDQSDDGGRSMMEAT